MGGIAGHRILAAPGTYTESFMPYGPLCGQSDVISIIGDTTNPLNCILKPAANTGYCMSAIRGAQIYVDGFLMDQSNGFNDTIESASNSVLAVGANCQFSNIAPGFSMAVCYDNSKIEFEGGFTLYGRTAPPLEPSPQAMLYAAAGGIIQFNNNAGMDFPITINLHVNPNFSVAVYYCDGPGAYIDSEGVSFTGAFGGCPDMFVRALGGISVFRSPPMPGTIPYPYGGGEHTGGKIITTYL